ncbi:hypothetical protein [Paludisphaera mucosa]|uniref:Uncharacterized protein n=1 Tax=Paludisphaera mucosa TaxID=3030827 RepID=A0ABT6FE34_9BACT|nr:hypothetical protein [Paludisphaera mucosa]MDG3005804.1 hypothetical protein [Paludisphaera mucosa]
MQDSPNQAAAQKLAREMASWNPIELRVRRESPPRTDDSSPTPGPPVVEHFHLIQAPGRFRLESRTRPVDQPRALYVSIEFVHGTHVESVFRIEEPGRTSRESVRVGADSGFRVASDGVSTRPEPIAAFYLGTTPLDKVLPAAQFVGADRILDRSCDGFLLTPEVEPGSTPPFFVYWLDRETGVPLRVESHSQWVDYAQHRPRSTWSAGSLDEIDGRHFPRNSTLVVHDWSDPERPSSRIDHTTVVEEVALQREHPVATFRAPPSKDAYLVGEAATTVASSPLRARYPIETGEWFAAAGAWIGLAFIVAAVLSGWVAFRRPHSKKPASKGGWDSLD